MNLKKFWDKKIFEWDEKTVEEQLFMVAIFSAVLLVLVIFLRGIGDWPINKLLLEAAENFFVYFIILCITFLYRLMQKRIIRKKIFYVTWVVFFILSLPYIPSLCGYGTTQIGEFYESNEYREQYFVYIRNNSKQAKAYRCKADIYRGIYGYPSYTDEGEETFIVQSKGYFLEKVYWDNGGYLTFIDDDWIETTSSARIYPGKETLVTDCHDNDYYVTLTTEKVK